MSIPSAFLAWVAAISWAVHASEQCGGAGQPSCPMQHEVASGAATHLDGDVEDVGLLHLRTSKTLETKQSCQLPGNPCDTCISDPKEYLDLWESYAKPGHHKQPGCVSPELFGSIHGFGEDFLYDPTSQKAWIFSKVDLEMFLNLQWKYGSTDAAKVSAATFVIVGFGPPNLNNALTGLGLGVFNLPQGPDALKNGFNLVPTVPVFAWWFYEMSTAGYFIDYATQKQVVVAYSHVSWQNVLDVFSRLTQCSVASLKVANLTEAGWWSGCSRSSLAVYAALDLPLHGMGTNGCVQAFWANANKKWSVKNAGDVRMMLWQCYDVNPFNTGIGLGWNSYPNPLVCKPPCWQTNYDHYTGEEYVIDNVKVQNFTRFQDIELANLTAAQARKYSRGGFC